MTTILDLLGIDPVLLKYFPGWMVMPVALGLGGKKAATPVAKPLAPPAPPPASTDTSATERLIRDVTGLRSYQTTVLTRRRDHLVPGTGLPGRPAAPSSPLAPFVPSNTPVGPGGDAVVEHGNPNPFPWPPQATPIAPIPDPFTPMPPINLPPIPDFRDFYTPTVAPQIPGPGSVNMPPTVYGDAVDAEGSPFLPDVGVPIVQQPTVPEGTVNLPPTVFLGPVEAPPAVEKAAAPGVDTPVITPPAVPPGTVTMPDTVFLGEAPTAPSSGGGSAGGGAFIDRPSVENPYILMSDWSRIKAPGPVGSGTVNMPDTVFHGPVDGMRFGDRAPDWKHPFNNVDSFITDYSIWG